nr:hypothetical protein CFP56_54742 [Quercus suber]
MSHSVPSLHMDVIFDISSELLMKSVIRFKCVSKSWHSSRKRLLESGTFEAVKELNATLLGQRESATSSMVLRVRKCGMICLLCRPDNLFLLNPATHEYARIPDVPFSNPILAYGFSYASSIYDYKLVVLIKHEPLVAVFSVRTGLWKMVEGLQFLYIGPAVDEGRYGRHL